MPFAARSIRQQIGDLHRRIDAMKDAIVELCYSAEDVTNGAYLQGPADEMTDNLDAWQKDLGEWSDEYLKAVKNKGTY